MEPADGDALPFWSPPSTTVLISPRRRSQPSPLLHPVALILAVPILILLVLFFILPPFLSHTSQILRPNSVKRGWDSLNILLVLFAVLCGVFAKRNDDVSEADRPEASSDGVPSFVNRPRRSVTSWLDFPDQKEYNKISSVNRAAAGGMRRSSSSYPDLREESMWHGGGDGGNRSRFFDDFEVNFHRSPLPEDLRRRGRRSREAEREEVAETLVKEIPVDKVEVSFSAAHPKSPATPPPPPPSSSAATLKRRRSTHSVPHKRKIERQRSEAELSENQQSAPPPPPPPELKSPDDTRETFRRKKIGTTKEIATAITSFRINTGKPPKPIKPSTQYYDNAVLIAPPSSLIPIPPPPPPPPFRMPEAKFVAQGDFVRILRAHSSRCSSPELEDVDIVSVKSEHEDNSSGPSITCPSPDVNVKADTFIARLRDEWRLEKINSVKEKRNSG
ncbi:hypothetical protein BUALT_Bualt09G0037100 [Buddleja alternifolia]|uniref:Uncharacterized protein n=1 Tax=Buddleja alternifolia TaxID=168488 RepID=A0AAV6X8C0_9LAMI|nr:hypothetical protein BUALT_Bualt09G0037100 [Buddleja alternifolia]